MNISSILHFVICKRQTCMNLIENLATHKVQTFSLLFRHVNITDRHTPTDITTLQLNTKAQYASLDLFLD
uniref:Uncharacterized protein n=1 Tax=Arundo donax TaxID=35708 RepID=A0A0A9DY00_ARUDO